MNEPSASFSGSPSCSSSTPRLSGLLWMPEPRMFSRGWSLPPKKSCTTSPGWKSSASRSVAIRGERCGSIRFVPPGIASSRLRSSSAAGRSGTRRSAGAVTVTTGNSVRVVCASDVSGKDRHSSDASVERPGNRSIGSATMEAICK